jgi:hypothetical protein
MVILTTAIFLHVLVSLSVYLYVSGVFNTSYLRAFQFAFYILLIFFALTIGIGIEYFLRNLRPFGDTLAVVE